MDALSVRSDVISSITFFLDLYFAEMNFPSRWESSCLGRTPQWTYPVGFQRSMYVEELS